MNDFYFLYQLVFNYLFLFQLFHIAVIFFHFNNRSKELFLNISFNIEFNLY